MDLIDTRRGEGTGIANSGNTHVEYELQIYQHRMRVGSDSGVPTVKEIHGWIRPTFGSDREELTLEFNDESTLQFSFTDKNGFIHANGEIQPIA